jgi:glycosyl hydrolase family 19 (putative chitinase)
MTASVLLLQQQFAVPPAPEACWQYWDATAVASATGTPVENVAVNWPSIHAALLERNLGSRHVCAGVIATIAIETASSFRPVREAFWLSEDWRQQHLRYYPWYGRGYIQLTWESNYSGYGQAVGVDLVSDADRAMDPDVAAKIIAEFFKQSGAADAAERLDWAECRRRVQGGNNGLERLITIVQALGVTD